MNDVFSVRRGSARLAVVMVCAGIGIGLATARFSPRAGEALAQMGSEPAKGNKILDVATAAGSFKTLAAAIEAAGLVDALNGDGPFTVFAPTDEAFAKLPKGTLESLLKPENKGQLAKILTFHVTPGRVEAAAAMKLTAAPTLNGQRAKLAIKDGKLTIEGATIVKTDIGASNGVIHVIDSVILPAADDVVETAAKAKFKTLLAAATAAGLAETLKTTQNITVFAPTDEAFAKLPAGVLPALLKPENKATLQAILKYHVVASRAYADQAATAGSVKTLQGESVKFSKAGDALKVNGSTIIKTDIDASNGVIHVIDGVLLPPGVDASKLIGRADKVNPAGLIEMAIERGVPMFNNHNAEACAKIYEMTTAALMSMDDAQVPVEAKMALRGAMKKARSEHDWSKKAWAYRNGLDSAMAVLSGENSEMVAGR